MTIGILRNRLTDLLLKGTCAVLILLHLAACQQTPTTQSILPEHHIARFQQREIGRAHV